MPTIVFFVKFFERATYASDFVEGKLFCNTLGAFKGREGLDGSGRADRNEGTIAWLQPGIGRTEINGIDMTDDLVRPRQFQRDWLNYLHLFCVHAGHTSALDLSSPTNANIEDLRQELIIPERCMALGEHAVVVKNVPEFMARMKAVTQVQNYRISSGSVKYYDPESFHGGFDDLQSVFWKQEQYSDHQEYRFVIDTGARSDCPLRLDIGDISDITLELSANELNSEKFIGGKLELPGKVSVY